MGVGRLALKDVVGPSIQAKCRGAPPPRTDGLIERSVEPEACVYDYQTNESVAD